jgi:hypothetical protein
MILVKTSLLILSFVGYLVFVSTRISGGFYKAPFIYCCITSIILYVFGLIGLLNVGAVFTTGVGIVLLAISFKLYSKRIFNELIEHPGYFLAIAPYLLFYTAIHANFEFLVWDEFSYWASSTKIIVTTNAFFNENSPIFFKSYPPLQQLFQYYFVKLSFWSEKNVLYAQIFWTLSAILCVVGAIVKSPHWVPVLFWIACTSLYFFDYSYATLYSDALLGLCFAASVALAHDDKGLWRDHLVFLLSSATILLLKEIAIVLVLVSLAVFVLKLHLQKKCDTQSSKSGISRVLLPSMTVLLVLTAVHKSWSWYVAQIHATRDLTLPTFNSFTTQPLLGRTTATIRELAHRLIDTDYLILEHVDVNHKPALWLVFISFIALSGLVIAFTKKDRRPSAVTTFSVLPLGCLVYLGALFSSYLIIFSEYEGIRLASFERYISSYMLGWSLILFAFAANLGSQLKLNQRIALSFFVVAMAVYFVPDRFYRDITNVQSSGPDYQIRQSTEALANEVKKHLHPNQKVYFVAQNSNGLERVMFYYAMLPYTSSMSWCWSFGEKYAVGDVWTCDTPMVDLLKGYDYLALFRVDKQFWDLYSNLFDADVVGKTSGVFRAKRSDGVITKFEYVPQSAP